MGKEIPTHMLEGCKCTRHYAETRKKQVLPSKNLQYEKNKKWKSEEKRDIPDQENNQVMIGYFGGQK